MHCQQLRKASTCQEIHYTMKETYHIPINTLHNERKLAYVVFPSGPNTSALVKTTLHLENNLTHASFHSIATINPLPRNTLHHEQKLSPFRLPCGTSTSALPKATLHYEGNLTHAIFPSTVKAIQHMLAHFLAHAQVHFQN